MNRKILFNLFAIFWFIGILFILVLFVHTPGDFIEFLNGVLAGVSIILVNMVRKDLKEIEGSLGHG
jgi:hypothetical protein